MSQTADEFTKCFDFDSASFTEININKIVFKNRNCIYYNFYFFHFTDLSEADINSSSSIGSNNKLTTGGATFYTGPYLDGNGISNVTTQIGTNGFLPCKVNIHTK